MKTAKKKTENSSAMSVERRYSSRHPVDVRVQIRYRKRRFYCAHARNLSTDGMYLDIQAVTLPSGTLVELELDHQGRDWLVPAVVVHQDGRGIGVMFRDPQVDLFRDLTRSKACLMPPQRGLSAREPLAKH
jgi:hypothetical protein